MRLLEKKILLENILSDNQLSIKDTVIFSGYGHQISQSAQLFSVLKFLSEEEWNDFDFTPIEQIIEKYDATSASVITIDQSEFNTLNSYIAQLNQKIPIYVGIIKTITEDQDGQDINIKLASSIHTPVELQELIEQIVDLCKMSKIDGEEIQFKGFDKGTDWITLSVIGYGTYFLIIRCLKLAQEIQKTKQEYFKSKRAELDFRASLSNQDDYSKQKQASYEKKRVKILQDDSIDQMAQEIGKRNGFEKNEIREHAQKTTEALINIIGSGNEVHLSLNPPAEVGESETGLVNIDYSFLKKLDDIKEVKSLQSGKNENNEEEIAGTNE